LGYSKPTVEVKAISLTPASLTLGDTTTLSARIENTSGKPQQLVIDFGIHLVKKNGNTFFKVFKWANIKLAGHASADLRKNISTRQLSTRTYYPGPHKTEIIVNGERKASATFELSPAS
jgi:hypothetical protein